MTLKRTKKVPLKSHAEKETYIIIAFHIKLVSNFGWADAIYADTTIQTLHRGPLIYWNQTNRLHLTVIPSASDSLSNCSSQRKAHSHTTSTTTPPTHPFLLHPPGNSCQLAAVHPFLPSTIEGRKMFASFPKQKNSQPTSQSAAVSQVGQMNSWS